jgi:uncharacterized membrane protein
MQRTVGFAPCLGVPNHHDEVRLGRVGRSGFRALSSHSSKERRPRTPETTTMKFVQVRVPVPVEVPREMAFGLFADLDSMSQWSSTLANVSRDAHDHTLSHWNFEWNGVRLSWSARDKDRIELERISWESVDGLTHKGRVDFVELGPTATELTMTVDYDVASMLAVIMETRFIQNFVESAIKADLEKFRTYALRMQRRTKMDKIKLVS